MKLWPRRWRRESRDDWPREGWLELPGGESLRMVPVYRGRDEQGQRTWEMFLEGPASVTVPIKGLTMSVDRIPVHCAVTLALHPIDDDHVKVYSYQGFHVGPDGS